MTPEEFMLKVIRSYRAARETGTDNPKIRRGRSRSVSSQTEDLLAEYLAEADDSVETVYVDQPITVSAKAAGTDRAVTRYPDLVLVRNGVVNTFIDLKMDLGWARSKMAELCEKHEATLNYFAGRMGRLRDGLSKETREYRVSKKTRYLIAVVSGQNINQKQLTDQLSSVEAFQPRVAVLVLSNGVHPNSYELEPEATLESMEIYQDRFQQMTEAGA